MVIHEPDGEQMSQARKWKQAIIILLMGLISCCAWANGTSASYHHTSPKSKTISSKKHHVKKTKKRTVQRRVAPKKIAAPGRAMPWFNSIETDGDFDIQIHTSRTNRVLIQQTASDIDSRVEGGVLHLVVIPPPEDKTAKHSDEPPMPMEPIKVTVWMPELQTLHLNGTDSVMGDPIYSQWLNIEGEGQSHVILRGLINVNKINIHGASDVSLRWVQSQHLIVRGYDTSEIFLAGTADVLDAKLMDDAHLDARYLRSHTVLVQTEGGAKANVLALNSLNAFASGDSNIYYYKSPRYQLAQTEFMGNVLQLGYWK